MKIKIQKEFIFANIILSGIDIREYALGKLAISRNKIYNITLKFH